MHSFRPNGKEERRNTPQCREKTEEKKTKRKTFCIHFSLLLKVIYTIVCDRVHKLAFRCDILLLLAVGVVVVSEPER